MKYIILFLGLFFALDLAAQNYIEDLYGFKIGQYRESVKNTFGKPIQTGQFEDGFEYEFYSLKPDNSVSIGFEYSAAELDKIWSIQLTGKSYIEIVKGLKIGDSKKKVELLFGSPKSIEKVDEINGVRWDYENSNYSLEIVDDELYSFKILNNSSELFPKPDLSKLPSVDSILNLLKSGDKEKISVIISPSIKIFKSDKTFFFQKQFDIEKQKDNSHIYSYLMDKDSGIPSLVSNKDYEENIRAVFQKGVYHVIKFHNSSTIKEIVMNYELGKYRIIEINY